MAGPWEKYANPSTRYGADPVKVREQQLKEEANNRANEAAARAAAAAERANANSAAANENARIQTEMALATKGLTIGPDGSIVARPGGPLGGKPTADPARVAKLNSLIEQINRTQQLYNEGPGTTSGIYGLADYFPSDANVAFDTSGAQLSEKGLAAFRIPGSGTMTDRDAAMFERANMPTASTRDAGVEEQLRGIRSRVDEELQALGLPAANWTANAPAKKREETPVGAVAGNAPPAGPGFGDPEGDPNGFVPYGSTTRRINNPEWAGVNEAVKGMIIAGQTPDQIRAYLGQRGINTNVEGLNQAADYFRKTGKRDFRVNVDDIEVPMSAFEQFRNNAPQTAVGAGLTTAANAASFGIPQALAPEQMQYIRDQSPVASFVGDVAGIVGATSGIGAVGNSLARSLAPRALTGGGRLGSAARAVAPDAVYGAAYGGITEGDPLTGAATAAAGSGAGQLLGKGAQKLFQGARLDPNAQILRDAGMQNLTIGQSLGGFAKSLEDAGTSAPILGDIINARRAEGLQEFNLGRLNEAGAPIGATVTETGEDGLNQLMTQVGSAYDNATAGVNVPLDPQFAADMQAAAAAGQRLPPDYQVRFDKIGENRVGPIFDAGQMTGETYQQAMRGLKGARSSAGQAAPGFEQDYRDAVTLAMGALRGQMERGGGQNVIDGLAQADTANRLGKTLQNAMAAAKNDAGGAGVQIFTPAQLNTAAYAAQKKFPGPRPFADMTDAAQMVLPSKIPDSGTARRGASLLLPVSLGGTGAGLDYYLTQTPGEGGAAGLAAGALLLAGGSKGGQKALDALLFKRPDVVRRAGGIFGRRKLQKGLGASVVTAPLLIEQ